MWDSTERGQASLSTTLKHLSFCPEVCPMAKSSRQHHYHTAPPFPEARTHGPWNSCFRVSFRDHCIPLPCLSGSPTLYGIPVIQRIHSCLRRHLHEPVTHMYHCPLSPDSDSLIPNTRWVGNRKQPQSRTNLSATHTEPRSVHHHQVSRSGPLQ